MTLDLFAEIVGWIGMVCLLSAYSWTVLKPGVSDKLMFHVLNITGSMGIGWNAYWNGAIPPAVMNAIWICFALFAFRRIIKMRAEAEESNQS